jgi:Fic family protein
MNAINKNQPATLKDALDTFIAADWFDRYICGGSALATSSDVTRNDLAFFQLNGTHTHPSTARLHHDITKFQLAKKSVIKSDVLTLPIILECHAIVMGNDKNSGKIRSRQNWIGKGGKSKAIYVCPEPSKVSHLLNELLESMRDTKNLTIAEAIKFYSKFLLIHPFMDGNGRVSRLLMHYFQIQLNEPIHFSIFRLGMDVKIYQAAVMGFIADAEGGVENLYWKRMVKWLDAYKAELSQAQNKLQSSLARKFALSPLGPIDLLVIKTLISQPVISINFLIRELQLSHTEAEDVVRKFLNLGVLEVYGQSFSPEPVYVSTDITQFFVSLEENIWVNKEFTSINDSPGL